METSVIETFTLQRSLHKASALRKLGISGDMYDRYTALLAPEMQLLDLRKGEFLHRAGNTAPACCWLASGVARRGYIAEDGADITLEFAAGGDSIGAYNALQTREFVVAESPLLGFCVSVEALDQQRQAHAFVREYYMKALEYSVRRYAGNLYIRSIPAASQRLAAFRTTYPELEQRISQRALASFLGVTSQYMSQLVRAA